MRLKYLSCLLACLCLLYGTRGLSAKVLDDDIKDPKVKDNEILIDITTESLTPETSITPSNDNDEQKGCNHILQNTLFSKSPTLKAQPLQF